MIPLMIALYILCALAFYLRAAKSAHWAEGHEEAEIIELFPIADAGYQEAA